MTDRRGDEGYAVAPVRIGGSSPRGPRRGRRIGVLVVLGASLAIVAAAVIGPRLEQRPNFDVSFFATPVPDATPTPTPTPTPFGTPGPTPLPAVARATDRTIAGRIGIWTDAFRVLDLESSGTLPPGAAAVPGQDAVVPAPDGDGWICVCMMDRQPYPNSERDVQVVRISAAGQELSRGTAVTLHGVVDPNGSSGIQTDVELAADGRSGLLAIGTRSDTGWDFSIAKLDLVEGTVGKPTRLGRQALPLPGASNAPTASPLPGATPTTVYTDVYGPVVRLSPDGQLAFAWTTMQQYTENEQLSMTTFGWRVQVEGSGIAAVDPTPALAGIPPYCNGIGFIREDRFVSACPVYDANATGTPPWRVIELDRGGTVVAQKDVATTQNWFSEPLFDRANGVIWLWDPTGQDLTRVDTTTLATVSKHYDHLVDQAPGVAPLPGGPPAWIRPVSSVGRYSQTEMTGAPDGSRIYAIGYGQQQGDRSQGPPSYGIFVIDPKTLALVGRWKPATEYVSVQPILGGSAVAVVGAPGADANGDPAPWEASVTILDVADGRILVRFGRLGEGYYPYIVGS